ncbi:STAG domain-containing protein [Lipomyces arxii]|uniref:STAG domain-containing protein n=1 Tax=Lipomyces arxii TaxID=56418 RepID=UPI0034CFFFA8
MSEIEDDIESVPELESDEDIYVAPKRSDRPKKHGSESKSKKLAGARKKSKAVPEIEEEVIEENALFEAVKDSGTALEETATEWVRDYERKKTEALREMVCFILMCCGCNTTVTGYDIEDQDSATQTLAQIQDRFGQKKIVDYPLVSKRPEFKKFRSHLLEFFSAFIRKSAERELLYDDESLMENMQVWITAMSSSTLRPFRYTATTIGLRMLTTLCEVAADVAKATGRSTKLLEKEKEKSKPVKDRVNKMQATVDGYAAKTEVLESLIHDLFDTIFVHRYRDVDAKIRTDCMRDLTKWMQTLPDVFFEGQYLRYLGWILSDPNGGTRLEVVKGLTKLYKDRYYVGGLRQFTERFRPRLLEMATHDVDHTVRMAVIELLDSIRAIGFLEQEDIDEVSGLVFDSNPRVRKAVVGFLMANIKEVVSTKLEEIGDAKEIRLYLTGEDDVSSDDEDENEHAQPGSNGGQKIRRSWFVLKTIVEILDSHNPEELGSPIRATKMEVLVAGRTESRFSIAAQALWESTSHLPGWSEVLRYALFDNSPNATEDEQSIARKIQKELELTAQQELILLDVAIGAVEASKSAIDSMTEKRSKRTSAIDRRDREMIVSQELVPLIPQLLKKFSSDPETTASVLRLHNFVNMDAYQQLRQKSLFEEVFTSMCKLFMSFDSASIMREFVQALLHAQACDYVSDAVELHVKDLQDEVAGQIRASVDGVANVSEDILSAEQLASIKSWLVRMMHLIYVVDVTDSLEAKVADTCVVEILLTIMFRVPESEESDAMMAGISIMRFYVMWKVKKAIGNRSSAVLTDASETLETLVDRYERLVESGSSSLSVRHAAICAIVDVMTSVNVLVRKESVEFKGFVAQLSPRVQRTMMKVFGLEEKAYARATRVKLNPEVLDGENEVELEEEESEVDEEVDGTVEEEGEGDDPVMVASRAMKAMDAELMVCELAGKIVIAVLSGSMDSKYAERLMLNAKVLGPGYDRVVNELAQVVNRS